MKRVSDDSARSGSSSQESQSLGDYFGTASPGRGRSPGAVSQLTSSPTGTRLELEQLLARQQQQSTVSPSLPALLAQQRVQQLQQQLGGTTDIGRLNTLAILQQRQQEQALVEQFRAQQQQQDLLALNDSLLSSRGGTSGLGVQHHLQHEALLGALSQQVAKGLAAPSDPSQSNVLPSMNAVAAAYQDKMRVTEQLEEGAKGGKVSSKDGGTENEDESEEANVTEEEDDADEPSDTFPFKLYRMLAEAEKDDNEDIVSFNSKGRCFMIHKPREFVSDIMPKYFTTSRMSSFQRQLNLYGFRRISEGPDKGGYVHEYFVKGRRSLCKKIKRKKPSIKLPPQGIGYMNPSMLGASNPSLSVRQLIADGQLADGSIAGQRLLPRNLLGPGALAGGGVGAANASLAGALLMEQQLRQQQQNELLQQLILRQKQESEIQILEEQRRRLEEQNRK